MQILSISEILAKKKNFEELFYYIDHQEMSKKGIPQRYPYKKRWYVNEINFFSKNVIIEVHATHHFVSL